MSTSVNLFGYFCCYYTEAVRSFKLGSLFSDLNEVPERLGFL